MCDTDIPPWPCPQLFSIRSSVFCFVSSFFNKILSVPSFLHIADHFLCNPCLPCRPLNFPTTPHIALNKHFLKMFNCSFKFLFSHSIEPSFFFSTVYCTLFRRSWPFCTVYTGLHFWNPMIFFKEHGVA
jgi:hypothetical protein